MFGGGQSRKVLFSHESKLDKELLPLLDSDYRIRGALVWDLELKWKSPSLPDPGILERCGDLLESAAFIQGGRDISGKI